LSRRTLGRQKLKEAHLEWLASVRQHALALVMQPLRVGSTARLHGKAVGREAGQAAGSGDRQGGEGPGGPGSAGDAVDLATIEAALGGDRWRYAARAYDARRFRSIMKWNGLLTEDDLERDALIPEYAVAVWQQDAIAVYHRPVAAVGGPLGTAHELPLPEGGWEADRRLRRLARTAVRAVYALGLDVGLVRLALSPRGRPAVRGVDPFPAGLAGKYAAALLTQGAAAIAAPRRVSTNVSNADVVLGLDVEFVLTTPRGELVPADRFLPRSGPAGHDAAVVEGRVVQALAELRPAPSGEPRELLANLQRAMRLAAARIPEPALEWRAGSSPAAGVFTGGHIHLSGVPLTNELLRTLDNYLALPLSLLEDAPARARRPAFGWLGNARRKAHGGFEYRTLASWLATPEVARGVIALAKLIASDHALLRERPLDDPEMQLAYYQADKAKLRQALPAWRRDIVRCPAYRRYESELEPFIELLESGWSWDEVADIRPAWGIVASLSQANLPHASLAAD